MTDLFLAIPVSGRVVADRRSPSARPITVFYFPPLHGVKRQRTVQVRHYRDSWYTASREFVSGTAADCGSIC
jgi:hypothetical protein